MRAWTMLRMVTAALMCATAAACGGTTATAPPPATTTPPLVARPPDPATIAANELGQIPILMYHRIETDPGSEYDETPQQFTAELDRLYTEGYRPITIATFLSGSIDLPAGTHPVILTFDDSTRPQLTLTASGDPTPDCAVGLLEQFHSRHPDFAATATFYVNNDPFGADPRTLPWLARHGYDLGAHTATHANLARLPATDVQRELVQNIRAITAATPGTPLRSMALPLGVYPADRTLAASGSWDGTSYNFAAVLLVGANPAPSPFATNMEPTALPRIRSGRTPIPFASTYWLDWLAANPTDRYTSDGDPTHLSFPRSRTDQLSPRWTSTAQPY
ncbi:polysaccharide deacetylase family protein [Nocardia seriolae]|uniref:polysaccharide deacetylase family protein n=1 Tax=Nocardia seriolae TaxID=37332 RepID=UPI0008FF4E3F|nr:polysaccharide deacetylase family protein [Nocardia seriolae]OJF82065.1 polysaccharide deacetylase [Nocardia seriolae]WNJ61046.1 polysaccharide deacetylase family protein [Nocardia seriolae]